MQVPTLHFHFDLTFVHSLSFRAKLGGQGVLVAKKPGQLQVPDLNQKNQKVNH
jgi:hypothetical protein